MTSAAQIILAAIPDATGDDIEHVLWARTPFPVGRVTAQSLYRAASGWARAGRNGIQLCDHCRNPVAPGRKNECDGCGSALDGFRAESHAKWFPTAAALTPASSAGKE